VTGSVFAIRSSAFSPFYFCGDRLWRKVPIKYRALFRCKYRTHLNREMSWPQYVTSYGMCEFVRHRSRATNYLLRFIPPWKDALYESRLEPSACSHAARMKTQKAFLNYFLRTTCLCLRLQYTKLSEPAYAVRFYRRLGFHFGAVFTFAHP